MADGFSLHDDEDLRPPEQRAAVFDAAPDPVLLLNAQGEILRANPAAQSALGPPGENLVGHAALHAVGPEQQGDMLAAIAAAAQGQACGLNLRTRNNAGHEKWWAAQCYPLDPYLPAPVVMTWRDITAATRRDRDLGLQADILRAIAEAAPLDDILESCCRLAEQALDGASCCVLLHDPAAAPPTGQAELQLPSVLVAALHDVPLADATLSAGAQVARFRVVVAPFDPFLSRAAPATLSGSVPAALSGAVPAALSGAVPAALSGAVPALARASSTCWSLPLHIEGRVVGTLAAYVRAGQPPSDAALTQVWHGANLACLALAQSAARRALADSENRFRIAAELLPGFLWVSDAAGRLTYVNRFYREYTGHSAAQLIDGAWIDTIHPDDRADCVRLWENAIESGTEAEARYRIRSHTGQYRWFIDRGMPLREDNGNITAWIGVAMDIDELTTSREAIQRYRAELEEQVNARSRALSETASELHAEISRREQAMEALAHKHKIDSLGQLTAGVAHDFNNLLVAIMGGFQLIDQRTQDPGIAQLTRNGLHASERAASLVRQILSVARREPPRPEAVDLAEILPAMHDLLRHALHPRQTLIIDVTPNTGKVIVDAPQLETALLNLAVNARDAMEEGGRLTIEAANQPAGQDPPERVVITVTDTGIGIAPQWIDRVCDPFFTTKPRGEGTGLGLAMVKNFVTAAGGDMLVQSAQGQGTSIHLRLPYASLATAPATAPSHTAEAASRHEFTALVVEDDEAVRPITCAFLRDAGYRILEAAQGPVALALLQVSGHIDILVTDLEMPGMDGMQLARAVRAARPGLPAVLVTSHADSRDLSDEIVVRKPFTGTDLTQAVAQALGRAPEPARRTDRLLGLMRSHIIREAYLTWHALRGDQKLPRFGALTVAGRAWAEHAFLIAVDQQPDPPQFRCVSVGRMLAPYLNYTPGELISDASPGQALLGPLDQIYAGCMADFMPHFQAVEIGAALGERLLMPVTSEAGGVTHLLGILAIDP